MARKRKERTRQAQSPASAASTFARRFAILATTFQPLRALLLGFVTAMAAGMIGRDVPCDAFDRPKRFAIA